MASQLDYTTYVSQIANMIPVGSTDAGFTTMLPDAIDYAEGRMYYELDLLAWRVTDSTTVSSGNRNMTLPTNSGSFLVVEGINIISPSSLSITSSGNRNPVTFTSREFIDATYPSNSVTTGVPLFAARTDNTTVIFGPAPDAPYVAEVYGTQRPTALSSGNSSTILTQMLPEAFFACSMVFVSGYMRNFGAQGSDPQMSQSWETQYRTLMNANNAVEFRKKYQSQGWTPAQPNAIATPQRV